MAKYKDAVINAIVVSSDKLYRGTQAAVLKHLLRGDWASFRIALYLFAGTHPDAVPHLVAAWARETASALLPCMTALFARHRWCTSGDTIASVALLALCHGLLFAVLPEWMRLMKCSSTRVYNHWIGEDNGTERAESTALVASDSGVRSETFWQAFNNRARTQACNLASDPNTLCN